MITSDNRPAAPAISRRIFLNKVVRRETIFGWLFVLPALVMYAAFVLLPLLMSIQYSFVRWDGIGSMTWVGLKNYTTVLEVPDLFGTIINAFQLVVFFSFIPVSLGLVVASIIHRVETGRLGAIARTVLFLPQVIPLVAAGIIWVFLSLAYALPAQNLLDGLVVSGSFSHGGWTHIKRSPGIRGRFNLTRLEKVVELVIDAAKRLGVAVIGA